MLPYKLSQLIEKVIIPTKDLLFLLEFDLLTFLAENPNHVYTKDKLFREIWDMESVGDIATVTVHIKKIREKIELDAKIRIKSAKRLGREAASFLEVDRSIGR